MPAVGGALEAARRGLGRALGPLTAPRSGWFYVTRRTALGWIDQGLRFAPTRVSVEAVPVDELADRFPAVVVTQVHPPESFPAPRFVGPAATQSRLAPARDAWTARGCSVLELSGGLVFGEGGWVGVDADHVVVDETMFPWTMSIAEVRRAVAACARGEVIDVDGCVVDLLHPGMGNYAHFLLQGLPRLDAMARVVDLDRVEWFLVRDELPPFVAELLGRFGITEDRILVVPRSVDVTYRCEHLVTATWPHAEALGPRWVVDAVRSRFAAEVDVVPDRRWYVTREPVWKRRVVNEAGVRALLAERGFEAVTMDGCTVAEQARLLARAELVVGLHGASLANLVFAPDATPVVELIPANAMMWMFTRFVAGRGTPYAPLLGVEPRVARPGYVFLEDADTEVDLGALGRLVDAMGAP